MEGLDENQHDDRPYCESEYECQNSVFPVWTRHALGSSPLRATHGPRRKRRSSRQSRASSLVGPAASPAPGLGLREARQRRFPRRKHTMSQPHAIEKLKPPAGCGRRLDPSHRAAAVRQRLAERRTDKASVGSGVSFPEGGTKRGQRIALPIRASLLGQLAGMPNTPAIGFFSTDRIPIFFSVAAN